MKQSVCIHFSAVVLCSKKVFVNPFDHWKWRIHYRYVQISSETIYGRPEREWFLQLLSPSQKFHTDGKNGTHMLSFMVSSKYSWQKLRKAAYVVRAVSYPYSKQCVIWSSLIVTLFPVLMTNVVSMHTLLFYALLTIWWPRNVNCNVHIPLHIGISSKRIELFHSPNI